MRKDDKRKFREEKREKKRAGNKRKRAFFKKNLEENPEEAHMYGDEDFNSSKYSTKDFKYKDGLYE